ncbi:MAG: ABC transporter substrate-binding protein [Cocleimonas sp.]|nr:ABC transporter substrate-binding protein [Cocleimonas sp.]
MKLTRRSLLSLLVSSAVLLPTLTQVTQAADKHVAITQIVEHPALDACRKGVKDELAEQGFIAGRNLKWSYESAQGAPATAAQIAKKFAGEAPDVVVGISTPSAQALASSARNIQQVFSAVTDPVDAKLVKSMDKANGGNITGVSDLSPIDSHMKLIKTIVPNAKKVGVIFNPGEANSATLVELVKKYAPDHGMEVVEAGSPKSSDVLAATRSFVGKVDVIYVPTDNTVASALEAVIKVAIEAKIPVISADTGSVKRGTIAAQGFNYYDLGRQTGKMVVDILKGKKAGDISPQGVSKTELYVNPESAKLMGVTLSDALIKSAKKVVKTMTKAEREAAEKEKKQ